MEEVEIPFKTKVLSDNLVGMGQPDLVYRKINFTLLDEDNYGLNKNFFGCREELLKAYACATYPDYHKSTYNYGPVKHALKTDALRLLLSAEANVLQLETTLKLLQSLEGDLKFTQSKLFAVKNRANMYLFIGSKDWFRAPLLLSFYILLIRSTLLKVAALQKEGKTSEEINNSLNHWTDVRPSASVLSGDYMAYVATKKIIEIGVSSFFYVDPHLNFARKNLNTRPQIKLAQAGPESLYRAAKTENAEDFRLNFPKKIDWAKLAAELE